MSYLTDWNNLGSTPLSAAAIKAARDRLAPKTLTVPKERLSREGPGLPVEVGLLDTSEQEFEADWYHRLPWALQVEWHLPDQKPARRFTVAYLVWFAEDGLISDQWSFSPIHIWDGDGLQVTVTPTV